MYDLETHDFSLYKKKWYWIVQFMMHLQLTYGLPIAYYKVPKSQPLWKYENTFFCGSSRW